MKFENVSWQSYVRVVELINSKEFMLSPEFVAASKYVYANKNRNSRSELAENFRFVHRKDSKEDDLGQQQFTLDIDPVVWPIQGKPAKMSADTFLKLMHTIDPGSFPAVEVDNCEIQQRVMEILLKLESRTAPCTICTTDGKMLIREGSVINARDIGVYIYTHLQKLDFSVLNGEPVNPEVARVYSILVRAQELAKGL